MTFDGNKSEAISLTSTGTSTKQTGANTLKTTSTQTDPNGPLTRKTTETVEITANTLKTTTTETENATDKIYSCAKCKDTGVLEDGSPCTCYAEKLERINGKN